MPTLSPTDQLRIEIAQGEAETAKTTAMEHATSARSKATMARAEATKARAAADMAMKARTNHAEADKKAKEAEAAATAAETAATEAEAAAKAAEAAYMASKAADVTVETAHEQRDEARKQRDIAKAKDTGEDGANAHHLAAKTAMDAAVAASKMYALELFKTASGQGMDAAEKKTRIMRVETAIKEATDRDSGTGNRDFTAPFGASERLAAVGGNTGADYSVRGLNQLGADGDDPVTLRGAVVRHPIGKARVYQFNERGNEQMKTPDPESSATGQATQRDLPMLGGFTGVELSKGTLAAHIYTDYDPSKRKAAIKAGNISRVLASSGTVSGTFDLSSAGTITALTGSRFTKDGVTYSDLTLECAAATADCSYTSAGAAATATITSLGSGWKVTGTAAAVAEMGDPDYMTFGYWLNTEGTSEEDNPYLIAFAGGNKEFATSTTTDNLTRLTGNATYRGRAAGIHAKTGAELTVQPFDARAELKAEFGTAAAAGTLGGRIYEINSGGEPLTLGGTSEITLTKTTIDPDNFLSNGVVRMGKPTVDPAANTAIYPYNGSWGAYWLGDPVDTDDTAKQYPTSVAGTFGVSGTDKNGTPDDMRDDVTHSLIGAFGAKLEQ